MLAAPSGRPPRRLRRCPRAFPSAAASRKLPVSGSEVSLRPVQLILLDLGGPLNTDPSLNVTLLFSAALSSPLFVSEARPQARAGGVHQIVCWWLGVLDPVGQRAQHKTVLSGVTPWLGGVAGTVSMLTPAGDFF